ncbi:integrase catalytic domain-containing protein [Trichonephila clavipes]|nr:integrase catalytic domain-containing protein [Trichonephila clavipes]
MFRQIEIHPHQRHFQKIPWKKGLNEPVQVFKLKTITYGATPAWYLSTRVLKQLSLDERENFPKAADIVLHDVYLDDILSGCSSLNELESPKTELTQLFKSAGMSLHKWCFSHSTNNFPGLHFDQSCEEGIIKTLGVLWNSSSDTFCFKVSPSTNHIFTKKDVLFQITRIFDPLGLSGPVISKAKFFMQQLWLLKLEWHEKLPVPVAAEWASFVKYLPVLEKLKIPRFVLSENLESIILYGFSDASEKGFGAVTYVSVIKNNGDRHSQLLCRKSRVAPLKTLTIPRFLLNARSSKNKRVLGLLSLKEINQAELWLIKLVQKAEFCNEIKHLLRDEPVHRSSKLSALNCFVDENNIIGVGGRLQNSPLSKNQKYPIVIPTKHVVTLMIIKYYHVKYLHIGSNNFLYHVRQKYWPLNPPTGQHGLFHPTREASKTDHTEFFLRPGTHQK